MTDKPILFQPDMALAAWEGRKTQTRRLLKHDKGFKRVVDITVEDLDELEAKGWDVSDGTDQCLGDHIFKVPYQIGDLLWVRETVLREETDQGVGYQVYAAGHKQVEPLTKWYHKRNVIPSIHMPRWASRMTLTVTDVRVQRLQDITRGDAMDEGCSFPNMAKGPNPCDWFHTLINSINGPDTWAQNPWVAAYTFTVEKRNIDQADMLPEIATEAGIL